MAQDKPKMSDIERLELATKLDNDLDDFISGLEKKRYTDGWPEDRWEEEMDKHPFFMKTPPKEGDELHPLMEGLQQLKYDPEQNTIEDLAFTYKEDGNFYVKHKKYRMAIFSYTEGINMKCQNNDLNATLYNNRSAAQFFIKNYRSSISDAEHALKLNPSYIKAEWRIAQCYIELKKYEQCIEVCENILDRIPTHEKAIELKKICRNKFAEISRNERKQQRNEQNKISKLNELLKVIQDRNIQFEEYVNGKPLSEQLIKPHFEPLEDYPVHLDTDGVLCWPAAFCYPEYLFSDFQRELLETLQMQEILYDMFQTPLECDIKNEYKSNNLNVYYENQILGKVFKVDIRKTLKDIITEKNFLVRSGCLVFFVVPKDSQVEQDFVNTLRRPVQC